MKGWDDKIAELSLRGRVRDTFDKAQLAREWNTGNREPAKLNAAEGGVVVQPTHAAPSLAVRHTSSAAPFTDAVGSASCKASVETINAGAAIRKDAGRQGPHTPVGSTPAPSWPKTAPGKPVTSLYPRLCLPWPPTGNTAVRHANGAHYVRQEVIAYRNTVAELCVPFKCHPGPYILHLELSPPDRRKRDADNAIKTVLDAIKGRLIEDDSMTYMRELHVTVSGMRGNVVVSVEPAEREAA